MLATCGPRPTVTRWAPQLALASSSWRSALRRNCCAAASSRSRSTTSAWEQSHHWRHSTTRPASAYAPDLGAETPAAELSPDKTIPPTPTDMNQATEHYIIRV